MLTSVHVANIGPSGLVFRAPKPAKVDGLISADGGIASILGPSFLPKIQPTRVGMIAFWEDQGALDDFLASHPTAERLAGGWQARLEPLRAYGSWPGLDDATPKSRQVDTEGPVVVTTLARLKWTRAREFFATTAKAEGQVMNADGLIWATGFGAPPFLGTISLWESAQAAHDYAYGTAESPHPDAIAVDRGRTFHHEKAFIRFRPLAATGSVDGKNPLPHDAITV